MANELATIEELMFKRGKPISDVTAIEEKMFSSPRALTKRPAPLPPAKMTVGKAIFTPAIASKALGVPEGMTPGEQFKEMYGRGRDAEPMPYPLRFANEFSTGVAGDIMDMATTPFNYAVGPIIKYGSPLAGLAVKKGIGATQAGAKDTAVRIAQNIIRPTGQYSKTGRFVNRGLRAAETSLEEGVLRSSAQKTAEKAQGSIDQLMAEVDTILNTSKAQVELRPAYRRIAAVAKYWVKHGEPERAQAILEKIRDISVPKGINPNTVLSAQGLNRLRQGEDEVLKRLYPGGAFWKETLPAAAEARQEFAGGMRKSLAKAVPEAAAKNQRISKLIDVQKISEKRGNVSGRNEGLSLGDLVLLGLKSPLLIAKKGYQLSKAPIARGLYAYSKLGAKRPPIISPSSVSSGASAATTAQKSLASAMQQRLLPAPEKPIIPVVRPEPGQKSLPPVPYGERTVDVSGTGFDILRPKAAKIARAQAERVKQSEELRNFILAVLKNEE